MKASIIIATYNRGNYLMNTIHSVFNQDFDECELLVIDQSDHFNQEVDSYLRLHSNTNRYYWVTPASLPAARNFGIRNSSGGIIVFIDDDVVLDPGFITNHVNAYSLNNEIAGVVGRIKLANVPESKELIYFTKDNFTPGGFDYPKDAYVETVQGCNMSFRRDLLEKVGGFDTNYIGNALREDSDIAFRLRKMGYKIFYSSQASLTHLYAQVGGCRELMPIYNNYIYYRNEMYFFLNNRPKRYLIYFLYSQLRTYVVNKITIKENIVISRLSSYVKGFLQGIAEYISPSEQIESVIKSRKNRSV